jgi:hypothetical protein
MPKRGSFSLQDHKKKLMAAAYDDISSCLVISYGRNEELVVYILNNEIQWLTSRLFKAVWKGKEGSDVNKFVKLLEEVAKFRGVFLWIKATQRLTLPSAKTTGVNLRLEYWQKLLRGSPAGPMRSPTQYTHTLRKCLILIEKNCGQIYATKWSNWKIYSRPPRGSQQLGMRTRLRNKQSNVRLDRLIYD